MVVSVMDHPSIAEAFVAPSPDALRIADAMLEGNTDGDGDRKVSVNG
jgi:hypothetical protein